MDKESKGIVTPLACSMGAAMLATSAGAGGWVVFLAGIVGFLVGMSAARD